MKDVFKYFHLYICKPEWLLGKHIWVDGNINICSKELDRGCTTRTGYFKCREVKTGFYRNKSMQTGSSGTLIGWKSGQTTFVPLWDRMEGAWLRTQGCAFCPRACQQYFVYRRNFNFLHACVYMVHYIMIWGRSDWGFWLWDAASLVLYTVSTHLREMWQNSCTGLLYPFLYSLKLPNALCN